jgi:dTMP kinase
LILISLSVKIQGDMTKFKGKLITLEGPEGSGKSTQVALLYKYLRRRKKKVISFREPGSTMAGERIRHILLNDTKLNICALTEMLLYEAARAQFVSEKLVPALRAGFLVLLDRFTDATIAYQGYGEGLDLKLIEMINKSVTLGIEPNLTILLDIEAKKGLVRTLRSRRKDRMEQKSLAFHNRVREGYLKLSKKKARIKVIDARGSIEEIQAKIREIILDAIRRKII